MVAGLGGLLYGIDVGIIGGALPYLEATSKLDPSQLSIIVAAVLLGSVFSTLFAGLLADWMGRKPLMILSGLAFILSIPVIALSHGYAPLFFGRLLQGMSGGLIGIVVPLYLAECLSASTRGKGTGVFQWMLTFGIVVAALIGIYFSYRVDARCAHRRSAALFAFKNIAWRSIFWVSMPPGILFVIGSLMVTESPRWLYRRTAGEGQGRAASLPLSEQATIELQEMEIASKPASRLPAQRVSDSLLRRKYVIPFLLACVILACNTATGINSVIGYNTNILLQSGLSDLQAHWGYVLFTVVNFCFTAVGMTLVDRKGRKFLFVLGTSGIILSMVTVGAHVPADRKAERRLPRSDPGPSSGQTRNSHCISTPPKRGGCWLRKAVRRHRCQIAPPLRSSIPTATSPGRRATCDPMIPRRRHSTLRARAACRRTRSKRSSRILLQIYEAARTAPLKIDKAVLGPVPDAEPRMAASRSSSTCSWRSSARSRRLRLARALRTDAHAHSLQRHEHRPCNQPACVDHACRRSFLPFVSKHGYSSMFFLFAGFTVVYFLTAAFLLPETKGKTLEEIEAHFEASEHADVYASITAFDRFRGRSTSTPCSSAMA